MIWRPSIRFYLVLMNLVPLCLLFPGASFIYLHQEAKSRDIQLNRAIIQMRQALEMRSGALVRSMAMSAGYAIAGYDYTFLNNMVGQVVSEDTEIRYCIIMDARGRAVAHSDPKNVGVTLAGASDQKARHMLAHEFPATISEDHPPAVQFIHETVDPAGERASIMEALTPIYSGAQLVAVLRCGVSLARLSAEIRTTRQDWAQKSRQFKIYVATITGLLFAFGVLIAALFTRAFVRSMAVVSTGVSRVSHGDLGHQIQPDELVCAELLNLSGAFNAMTRQLKVSRRQLDEYSHSLEQKVADRTRALKDAQANLLQQAHEAGMAEMAVGILHNIGNAITPAKVGLFRLFNRMGQKPLLNNLPAALDEIGDMIRTRSNLPQPEKDRYLSIIELVPLTIEEEYALNAGEIEQVRRKLTHIESIIGLQMRYTQLFGDVENVDIPQVVEDALTLLDVALKKRGVRVVKHFSPVPAIRIEKTLLIQVIVNLIKNGYEAMDDMAIEARTLVLSIRREGGPPERLVMSIKDNGIGFSPDDHQKLFKFGYTTKSRGSGFGLHSCANYLIARHGSIDAHSDGRGKGAEFVVRLAIDDPHSPHEGA